MPNGWLYTEETQADKPMGGRKHVQSTFESIKGVVSVCACGTLYVLVLPCSLVPPHRAQQRPHCDTWPSRLSSSQHFSVLPDLLPI